MAFSWLINGSDPNYLRVLGSLYNQGRFPLSSRLGEESEIHPEMTSVPSSEPNRTICDRGVDETNTSIMKVHETFV